MYKLDKGAKKIISPWRLYFGMLCRVKWQTITDILEERASEISQTIYKFTERNDCEDTNIHQH